MSLHLIGEVMHVDDHLLDAGAAEAVEGEVDQGPSRDLDAAASATFW